MRNILSVTVAILAFANVARADIYQWEYIDPADPGQGKRQSATLAPDGAGLNIERGASLQYRDLTKAYLIGADLLPTFCSTWSCFPPVIRSDLSRTNLSGADLTDANLAGAILTDADFTDAEVRGVSFRTDFCGYFGCSSDLTGTGITLDQLYSTASYKAKDLSGIDFYGNNLANADFTGQRLTSTLFWRAKLTDANFTGADVRRAVFNFTTLDGFTAAQLYSTASYQAHDLSGIVFSVNDLSGWNFAGQNITNAGFGLATLTGADLTAADARGGYHPNLSSAFTTNLIKPDGHIDGLNLGGGRLVVRNYRDYFGNPTPFPITVDERLAMGPGGSLRMVFDADAWDSTISFAPGIKVTLGGTLELTFANDVNLATQVGRTLKIFDWTGVTPIGTFAVSSSHAWNLSNLYSTGEVTLIAVPEPSDSPCMWICYATLALVCRRNLYSYQTS